MVVEVNLYIRQIKKGRLPKETVYDNLFRLVLNRGGGNARMQGKSSGEIRPLQGKKGVRACVYAICCN